MKIAILHASYQDSNSPTKQFDISYDPTPYLDGHEISHHHIHFRNISQQLTEIVKQDHDFYFNLCDGAADEQRAGIEVIEFLQRNRKAFSGARSDFYEPNCRQMKQICKACNCLYPASHFAASLKDLEGLQLPYPLLVKHPSSYNSIGMYKHNKVQDLPALEQVCQQMIDRYGEALIERFITGPEYTVLLSGRRNEEQDIKVYPPMEVLFPEGEEFKHFDLKWKDYADMGEQIVSDASLADRLSELSKQYYLHSGANGYARLDWRMDRNTEDLYFLEINPNCSVFYPKGSFGSADIILDHLENGHRHFAEHLIEIGMKEML